MLKIIYIIIYNNIIIFMNNMHNKEKDSIPMRIEFVKQLLHKSDLYPIVNLDCTLTENFTGGSIDEGESGDSYDTRVILKKRILNFTKIIKQIGGKLRYIKSGTTGHTFKGIAEDSNGTFEYAVKVVAYPKKEKYGSINDTRRPENAELMMIKLLSYFIVNKQTPHLVIPFGTFNTDIANFVDLVKCDRIDEQNERYKEFVDKYHKGEFSSTVSILLSEWANRGDLLDFMRNNYKQFTKLHWKVILFQIISTLAIIQSKYPSFRHNDFKANNILIQKIDIMKENHRYVIVRNSYRVPNIGYHIKIWDFDFACIPGIVDNIKVDSKWTKKINVTPEQNRYYDIHYFFNTLIRKGFFPQIITDDDVPLELKQFISRVVPKMYQNNPSFIHEKGRILINEEYLTPDDILKNDPYFEEFRMAKKTKKEEPIYDITKLMTTEQKNIPKSVYSLEESKTKTKSKSKVNSKPKIDIIKLLRNDDDEDDKNVLDQIQFDIKRKLK